MLASGRGTNLQALLQWERAGALQAHIGVVISNRSGAGALRVAEKAGVEAVTCGHLSGPSREERDLHMAEILEGRGVDLVVLAGYDRILSSAFVRLWSGHAINVHPSLLPAFRGGLHAQRDALQYGVKVAGCTVHFVTEDVDGGPIISQAAVSVLPDDDEESLSARILEQEHRLLPEAIRSYARGELQVVGRRVVHTEGGA